METRIREIDSEIAALREQMSSVEGQSTEVYSRIVGYYRSVKNWNLGKKGEYRERVAFTTVSAERKDSVSE
jgi:ribonucleoside-triphosphate reductase